MAKRSRVRGRLQFITAIVLGYWCLLFTLTHIPLDAVHAMGPNDKIAHFGGYGMLAWLAIWAISQKFTLTFKSYLAVWAAVAVYGVIDELLQMIPVIHRSADVYDWVADVVGATSALALFFVLTKIIKMVRGKQNSGSSS